MYIEIIWFIVKNVYLQVGLLEYMFENMFSAYFLNYIFMKTKYSLHPRGGYVKKFRWPSIGPTPPRRLKGYGNIEYVAKKDAPEVYDDFFTRMIRKSIILMKNDHDIKVQQPSFEIPIGSEPWKRMQTAYQGTLAYGKKPAIRNALMVFFSDANFFPPRDQYDMRKEYKVDELIREIFS